MKLMLRRGFTLIEIIIVVAILGILAIALLTALNPIEQISRATDTTTLTTAREFISSANQFQTAKQFSAACPDIACATFNDSLGTSAAVALSTLVTVNAAMEAAGTAESAANFVSSPNAASTFVTMSAPGGGAYASFIVCWQPQSGAFRSEADVNNPHTTVYDSTGALQTASACPADSSNTCYRCLRQ